jgi:hypothetical protein
MGPISPHPPKPGERDRDRVAARLQSGRAVPAGGPNVRPFSERERLGHSPAGKYRLLSGACARAAGSCPASAGAGSRHGAPGLQPARRGRIRPGRRAAFLDRRPGQRVSRRALMDLSERRHPIRKHSDRVVTSGRSHRGSPPAAPAVHSYVRPVDARVAIVAVKNRPALD